MQSTLNPALDGPRLRSLRDRVLDLMRDGVWRSPAEIQDVVGHTTDGILARLRCLKQEPNGGWTYERRRRGEPERGLWEYRVRALSPGQMELFA